jgi:hypothetical protein
MSRSPRRPTLLSVAKQAEKAGLDIARVEIEPTGKIVGRQPWCNAPPRQASDDR